MEKNTVQGRLLAHKCLKHPQSLSAFPETEALLPHVQGILELGAGVPGMKAFLVDGVVCVETDHQRVSCRVDFL